MCVSRCARVCPYKCSAPKAVNKPTNRTRRGRSGSSGGGGDGGGGGGSGRNGGAKAGRYRDKLASDGFVVLKGHSNELDELLRAHVETLEFKKMGVMKIIQPDELRRNKPIPANGELYTALLKYGGKLMAELKGDECPVFRPTILATAPGAM